LSQPETRRRATSGPGFEVRLPFALPRREGDRHRREFVREVRRQTRDRTCELHVRNPPHQFFEQEPQFEPRKRITEAEVRTAAPECLMRRLFPRYVEMFWVIIRL